MIKLIDSNFTNTNTNLNNKFKCCILLKMCLIHNISVKLIVQTMIKS